MTYTNTPKSYGAVTRAFHWLTAALILALLPLGMVAEGLPYASPEDLALKAGLFSVHKTLGVAVFFVAVARILWALTQPKPAPLNAGRRAEVTLAETIHWLLYGALVLVPLSGWVHHAATEGFAPIWWPFGQSLPFVAKSPAAAAAAGALHGLAAYTLAGAVALHVAGALKHALVDRDGTLARMVSGRPAGDPGTTATSRLPIVTAGVVLTLVAAAGLLARPEGTPTTQSPALAAVESGWQVQDGTLGITVRQFGADVTGSFADWTAAISFDEATQNGAHGRAEVTVSIPSLTLGSVTAQALGFDYFDAARFPTATFRAELLPAEDGGFRAEGTLTLRGVEVPVSLPFTLAIEGDTARMQGETVLDRRDFDLGAAQTDAASLGFEVRVGVTLTAERNTLLGETPKSDAGSDA